MIEHSESLFLNIFADCQEAYAYIENPIIRSETITLGIPITVGDNMIKIVNPSNLPINFKWENIYEADKRSCEFIPNSGLIEPNSYVMIKHKIIYYTSNTY